MKFYVVCLLCLISLSSCTKEKPRLPNLDKYEADSDLMVNVCDKFAHDSGDIEKLHKSVIAVQQTRILACLDYNQECNLYGECLTLIMKATQGNKISPEDQKKILEKLKALKKAVSEGKARLRKELGK